MLNLKTKTHQEILFPAILILVIIFFGTGLMDDLEIIRRGKVNGRACLVVMEYQIDLRQILWISLRNVKRAFSTYDMQNARDNFGTARRVFI